eukprot:4991916-Pyramimonas_sp.AAC.1
MPKSSKRYSKPDGDSACQGCSTAVHVTRSASPGATGPGDLRASSRVPARVQARMGVILAALQQRSREACGSARKASQKRLRGHQKNFLVPFAFRVLDATVRHYIWRGRSTPPA